VKFYVVQIGSRVLKYLTSGVYTWKLTKCLHEAEKFDSRESAEYCLDALCVRGKNPRVVAVRVTYEVLDGSEQDAE
jgi:hypothetical protein